MGRRQNGRETENSETKQARSKVDDWIKNTSHLPQETPPSEMDSPRLTPWPSLRRSASDLNVTTPRSSLLERAIVRRSSRERIAGMARVSREFARVPSSGGESPDPPLTRESRRANAGGSLRRNKSDPNLPASAKMQTATGVASAGLNADKQALLDQLDLVRQKSRVSSRTTTTAGSVRVRGEAGAHAVTPWRKNLHQQNPDADLSEPSPGMQQGNAGISEEGDKFSLNTWLMLAGPSGVGSAQPGAGTARCQPVQPEPEQASGMVSLFGLEQLSLHEAVGAVMDAVNTVTQPLSGNDGNDSFNDVSATEFPPPDTAVAEPTPWIYLAL